MFLEGITQLIEAVVVKVYRYSSRVYRSIQWFREVVTMIIELLIGIIYIIEIFLFFAKIDHNLGFIEVVKRNIELVQRVVLMVLWVILLVKGVIDVVTGVIYIIYL